jgi:predicted  nucleic acid-binding Zn-ribbon protein
MSSRTEIDQLQAEADYYRDRVALLRAKLYRWGVGTNARLQQLERELERAEQRLRDARLRRGAVKRNC